MSFVLPHLTTGWHVDQAICTFTDFATAHGEMNLLTYDLQYPKKSVLSVRPCLFQRRAVSCALRLISLALVLRFGKVRIREFYHHPISTSFGLVQVLNLRVTLIADSDLGQDSDPDCMRQDEVLYRIADKVKNFAVVSVVHLTNFISPLWACELANTFPLIPDLPV
jgi:hypothetical protein